jgi:hypothetical protein
MGCVKTAKKVLKGIARIVGPKLLNYMADMSELVDHMAEEDPLFFTNETKRKFVVAAGKRQARVLKQEVAGSLINAATEYVVVARHKFGATPADIGDPKDEKDIDTIPD